MSATLRIESRSLEHTLAVGAAVGRMAQAGDIVGLVGELGAGKTQFVRGLAEGLGLDPGMVSSPTFVLVHEYEPAGEPGPGQGSLVLVHIDAYRLAGGAGGGEGGGVDEGAEEAALESIGWAEELFEQAVVAVEWADVIEAHLGSDRLDVRLEHRDPGRLITLSAQGNWLPRMGLLKTELARARLLLQP